MQLVVVAPASASGVRMPEEMFESGFRRWAAARSGDAQKLEEMVEDAMDAHPRAAALGEGAPEEEEAMRFWVKVGLDASQEHYRGSWRMITGADCHGRLGTLRVPTLMVCGSADSLLSLNLKDYKEIRRVATLHVFSHCGHSPQREHPHEFLRVLLRFLNHGPSNWRAMLAKHQRRLQSRL